MTTDGAPSVTMQRVVVRCAWCGWERHRLLRPQDQITLTHYCDVPMSDPPAPMKQ